MTILVKWLEIVAIIFVIFILDNALYILVEFENDRRGPRENPKNRRIGAHELNCKIFVNSELGFEIYDKNYPRKKNSCLYDMFEIFVIEPVRSLVIGQF